MLSFITFSSFISCREASVDYSLTSGQVAARLADTGVRLSSTTIQRYARSGRIPSKSTPGGRYRYDLEEVLRALSTMMADQTLSRPILEGGIGLGLTAVDSPASTLRRAVDAHTVESQPQQDAGEGEGVPVALSELIRHSAHRAVALA